MIGYGIDETDRSTLFASGGGKDKQDELETPSIIYPLPIDSPDVMDTPSKGKGRSEIEGLDDEFDLENDVYPYRSQTKPFFFFNLSFLPYA